MKRNWKHYFIELLVIITGITISFLLNEWRESRIEGKLEIETLQQIKQDLISDTTLITSHLELNKHIFDGSRALLSIRDSSDINDSLNMFMALPLNITKFTPANIGYVEMSQTGNSRLISNKELLNNIILVYTSVHGGIQEWTESDHDFVINHLIPYYNKNHPYTGMNYIGLYKSDPDKFWELLNDDEFKNLIQFSAIMKGNSLAILRETRTTIIDLLAEIDAELERLGA